MPCGVRNDSLRHSLHRNRIGLAEFGGLKVNGVVACAFMAVKGEINDKPGKVGASLARMLCVLLQ